QLLTIELLHAPVALRNTHLVSSCSRGVTRSRVAVRRFSAPGTPPSRRRPRAFPLSRPLPRNLVGAPGRRRHPRWTAPVPTSRDRHVAPSVAPSYPTSGDTVLRGRWARKKVGSI